MTTTEAPAPLGHFSTAYLTGARLVSVNGVRFVQPNSFAGLLVEDVRLRRLDGFTFFELTVWMGAAMISLTIASTDLVEVTR